MRGQQLVDEGLSHLDLGGELGQLVELDQAERGRIAFDSPVGRCQADLEELTPQRTWSFGGMDMRVTIQRYPEQVTERELSLSAALSPPTGQRTPYLVKATQVDGHMAWSSPVYVTRRDGTAS